MIELELKEEIRVALVIDDYKLANREYWWREALKQKPEIERDFDLVREEIGAGISKHTTALYRVYKLKKVVP